MNIRNLALADFGPRPSGLQWEVSPKAAAAWKPISAAADDGVATLDIFESIGEDPWDGAGMTAKRVSGILRSIGKNPLIARINSPGGDVFEGLSIFNLLREHPADVTVKVMGIAASAASIIAMAGDRVEMGIGSMLMIHNSVCIGIGNRFEFSKMVDYLGRVDASMRSIYTARTGRKDEDVAALLDAETFLTAEEAVEEGFADDVAEFQTETDSTKAELSEAILAKRKLDTVLARAGMPRSERRALVQAISSGTHDAAGPAMHDAGVQRLLASMQEVISMFPQH